MTVGQFLRSYWKDCVNDLKHPLNLLPTVLLAVIWIVLGWMAAKAKLALPLKVVSFLTFTEGGLFGGVIGAVGGIVGKVVVAAFVNAALLPLFHGKMPFSGVGNSFSQMASSMRLNSAGALRPLFYGLGVALLLYSFMNVTQSGQNAMVGIVAVVMLLQNIGNKGGFLWGFLFSMANSVTGGRVPDYTSITRHLMGMTLGFGLAAGLSLSGLHWCFWLAWPMLLLGFLLGLFGKKKPTPPPLPRAMGAAFIVIATLLSAFDAAALSGSKGTKYGTLTYSIPNLDGRYKPGQHYTLTATFAANSRVYGDKKGWTGAVVVMGGGRTLSQSIVTVYKNKTTSTSVSFTAPTDGSSVTITFGGSGVRESFSISPMPEEVVKQEEQEEPSTTDESSNNDTDNASDNVSNADDNETTDDGTNADNADEENAADDSGLLPDVDFSSLPEDMKQLINEWLASDPLGLERAATPNEAVGIGAVGALISLLLGGGIGGALGGGVGGALGGLGGGAGGAAGGGSMPPPVDGPGGPSTPYQSVEDKYVTRNSDGSITVKDPVTGEQKLYLPDGQGGYDNPLGGGFQSEADMLEHLAYLDRNSDTLSQDAATAARNQAEQHAQWEEQSQRDAERGYSDESADFKKWREEEERKTEQIIKLANKYLVEANEDAVRKAIKVEQIKADIESAKQQAIAADKNVTVVGLESTKNVAATSLVVIPLALTGVGTVSVGTMAKVKIVQSSFTMAKEITDKVGDAYVEGKSMSKAAVHGVVSGTIEVAKNYAGDIGGKAAKLVPKAGEIGQKVLNLTTEAAVVVGGDGVKAGLDEYNKSGDLQKTLDASIKGMQKSAKTHAINKVAEVGIDKSKEFIKSRTSAVHRTRVMADDAAKKVTAGQQAVTRSQKQVTTAQQRVTAAQQRAAHSQQQVTTAQGRVNTANEQLHTANGKVAAAEQKLGQARTPAEASRAQAELKTAQQGAAQAQQNVNQARTELQTAQRVDTATQRVAQQAEQNLQKAQWGAQKAQSDLQTATAQRDQAMRDAWDAEQQAEVNEKLMSQVSGSDIVGGYRGIEEHIENIDKIDKDNT